MFRSLKAPHLHQQEATNGSSTTRTADRRRAGVLGPRRAEALRRGTAGFFEQIGLRPGKAHAWAAGGTEFLGGLAIALGLLTPIPAAALIAVTTAAVITVHVKNGFFNSEQGFEYNLVLVAALFALAGVGAGEWSLDNALGIDMAGIAWALGALGAGLLGGVGAVLLSGRLGSREAGEGHPSPA